MMLANARWRKLKTTGRDQEYYRTLKALDALLIEESWHKEIRSILGPGWSAALREAKTVLSLALDLDDGLFEGWGTDAKSLGAHAQSRHAMHAAWILDQHLKLVSKDGKTDLKFLGRLLSSFGLTAAEPLHLPKRLEKWLHLARRRAWSQTYFQCVLTYHEMHRQCAIQCGPACRAFKEKLAQSDQEEDAIDRAQDAIDRGIVPPLQKLPWSMRRKVGPVDIEFTARQSSPKAPTPDHLERTRHKGTRTKPTRRIKEDPRASPGT
jgi:hypothetical protein